jgi:hypothetical protein
MQITNFDRDFINGYLANESPTPSETIRAVKILIRAFAWMIAAAILHGDGWAKK